MTTEREQLETIKARLVQQQQWEAAAKVREAVDALDPPQRAVALASEDIKAVLEQVKDFNLRADILGDLRGQYERDADDDFAGEWADILRKIDDALDPPKPPLLKNDWPRWTVVYNINSVESDRWIGTGWEFFDTEEEAEECYARHVEDGNVPMKRPYFHSHDRQHLGACHRMKPEPPAPPEPPLPDVRLERGKIYVGHNEDGRCLVVVCEDSRPTAFVINPKAGTMLSMPVSNVVFYASAIRPLHADAAELRTELQVAEDGMMAATEAADELRQRVRELKAALQDKCHDLPTADYEAFCNGCDQYQREQFGKCRTDQLEGDRDRESEINEQLESELTELRKIVESVNALAREFGFGQGELDDDLAGCLRKKCDELRSEGERLESLTVSAGCRIKELERERNELRQRLSVWEDYFGCESPHDTEAGTPTALGREQARANRAEHECAELRTELQVAEDGMMAATEAADELRQRVRELKDDNKRLAISKSPEAAERISNAETHAEVLSETVKMLQEKNAELQAELAALRKEPASRELMSDIEAVLAAREQELWGGKGKQSTAYYQNEKLLARVRAASDPKPPMPVELVERCIRIATWSQHNQHGGTCPVNRQQLLADLSRYSDPPLPTVTNEDWGSSLWWVEPLRQKLKDASRGEVETWGFVAMFMEMIDAVAAMSPPVCEKPQPGVTLEQAERIGERIVAGVTSIPNWMKPKVVAKAVGILLHELGSQQKGGE